MVEWFDDHVIDEDGRRFALAVPWRPEWAGYGIPAALLVSQEERRAAHPPKPVTAAVTKAPLGKDEFRVRVYLQGELPAFGSGWHTLLVKLGIKWARLEDMKGRVRRMPLDKFNLLKAEFITDGTTQ